MQEKEKEKEVERTEADLFEIDTDLFFQQPREFQAMDPVEEEEKKSVCPYWPKACDWVNSWRCTDKCKYRPENYMQPEIKAVFDKTPHALYCFDCNDFVATRPHEGELDPPEKIGSHTVTTGFVEYKTKLTEWTIKRITGG